MKLVKIKFNTEHLTEFTNHVTIVGGRENGDIVNAPGLRGSQTLLHLSAKAL